MAYLLDAGLAIAFNNNPSTTVAYASGGAPGATSVTIASANSNIAYNQKITGVGFATNTTVVSVSGTTVNFTPAAVGQISGNIVFQTNWHYLTDHNRDAISIDPTLIEKESRMANGTMRKFVISKKDTISTSWENVPSSHIPNKINIISGTAVGNSIVFVTDGNHSFTTSSLITTYGTSSSSFNIQSATPTAVTSNTFVLSKTVSGAATGGIAEDLSRPSITTIDGYKSSAWLSAFYNANSNVPVFLKVTASKQDNPLLGQAPSESNDAYDSAKTGATIYNVFISNFSYNVSKRTKTTDYVDMSIEFTEI